MELKNPDGPREWFRQIEALQLELEATQIARSRYHSQLVRLQDALGANSFEDAIDRCEKDK
jgi:hypothetical protein